MKAILTENAPKPAGHYSQAIVHNGLVFVSGQLAIDPKTGEKKTGSIEEQTEQTLRNIEAILIASGSDLNHLLKTTAFIADNELWGLSMRLTRESLAIIDRLARLFRQRI